MDLVEKEIKPDYALGSHTASLGLTFANGSSLGAAYRGGAFVGQLDPGTALCIAATR
jgi:glucose/arabinose dehydrogenase